MPVSVMNNSGAADFEEWLAQGPINSLPGSDGSSGETSSAASPFDQFASLFDAEAPLAPLSDGEALPSNKTSVTNSPVCIKEEDAGVLQFAGDQSLAALALHFDGFDTAPQATEADNERDDADSINNEEEETQGLTQSERAAYKPKRAPRKRLTPHQKEAHNKIEKRYRININTKLAKLQQIIPWVASEATAFEVDDALRQKSSPTMMDTATLTSATPKLNKSMILEKAVDYILFLQNNERLYAMEVQRLKAELDALRPQ
ncbi:ADR370Wp [Eremothecium gossypii ATCC 10895]|uniref:ADR370Wp n=1 Tax=Eremothecium gossypii (strain ATCC 10895 / CBS 109.51 / FGSC 9923 / NRRL Y-1056) TaxID=284811 RepID=Q759A7_EREGS|nr:ADR370Wp [Eremothecium gossypii ATCC 10895]AAS52290.1 ADR370Wp [Eremothecium gossypii ATCC 10895]AEY96588.1 FADR370Wp [Eremothecium gossypii FDAG1]